MKEHPDINDTLLHEGENAVRARHDHAQKYQPGSNGQNDAPRQGTGPRIKLIPFDEIRLGTERRYLVKGLIPRVGLCVAWGPPKCGKSFWAFDLAMHVALGRSYRGRRVQAAAVVYCAFEGSHGFGARIEAFRQRFLPDDANPVSFFLEPVTLDLVRDHVALIRAIKAALTDESPAIIILDTLNRSLRGSESSDEDMTAYVRAADAVRQAFGCTVLIVHHCGIDGTRPRGHTSLTGAVDAQLAIKRDNAGNIEVKVEWMKDGPVGDKIWSRLEAVEVGIDEDGEAITSCIVVPVEIEHSADAIGPRLTRNQQTMTTPKPVTTLIGIIMRCTPRNAPISKR